MAQSDAASAMDVTVEEKKSSALDDYLNSESIIPCARCDRAFVETIFRKDHPIIVGHVEHPDGTSLEVIHMEHDEPELDGSCLIARVRALLPIATRTRAPQTLSQTHSLLAAKLVEVHARRAGLCGGPKRPP